MRVLRFAAVPLFTVCMLTAALGTWVVAAGASEPPPVILHSPRIMVHLAPGQSFTFRASAKDASTAMWLVKSPDGSSSTLYSGTNTLTKQGVLKSSFTFGPFNASQNGWEVVAGFVNDPTGVPSGIQESSSRPGVVMLKRAPKG
jgi:hypothetical protein